jgi:hypothetical protein
MVTLMMTNDYSQLPVMPGSSEPGQRLQHNRGLAEPGTEDLSLASQQQGSLPLTFEPECGDPPANVIAIETLPLNAQNSSSVLDLALRLGQLGPFELREENVLSRGEEDAAPAEVPSGSAVEFGDAEGARFPADEIDLPAGREVHHVEE